MVQFEINNQILRVNINDSLDVIAAEDSPNNFACEIKTEIQGDF